jgi:Zn-dependent protease
MSVAAPRIPPDRAARASEPSGHPGGRRGSIPVGRLAGIPIGVQPLWLAIVGLITWSLGAEYFPAEAPGIGSAAAYGLGLASALLLFAGILAHELGHAIVARRHGVRVEEIDLWLLGGVARLRDEPEDPRSELRFALAGPAVTVVLAFGWGILSALLGGGSPAWLRALVDYQLYVNAAILGLNLLPAFPLDGGRVLRALLWRHGGDQVRATDRAAAVGRGFGWGFVVLGLLALGSGYPAGMWTALIGGFLILASRAETEHLHVEHVLGDRRVAELMSSPAIVIPATSTIEEAIREGFARHLHRAFPVVDSAGRPVGLVKLTDVRAVPAARRARVTVGELADRDPGLFVSPDDALADVVAGPAFRRAGRAVVVSTGGFADGVLSTADIDRLVLAAELLGDSRTEAHRA